MVDALGQFPRTVTLDLYPGKEGPEPGVLPRPMSAFQIYAREVVGLIGLVPWERVIDRWGGGHILRRRRFTEAHRPQASALCARKLRVEACGVLLVSYSR